MNRIDRRTGRFLPTPPGTKTKKMLEVERRLGRTLEEDYQEYYIERRWGQKLMADRWGVKRTLIFREFKNGRRSWVQMLNLPVRRNGESSVEETVTPHPLKQCEVCESQETKVQEAHWVSKEQLGKKPYNILLLCPNCHSKLDRGDEPMVSKCGEVLLFKSMKRLLVEAENSNHGRRRLWEVAKAIIFRQPL
jgi:hypothetical protein